MIDSADDVPSEEAISGEASKSTPPPSLSTPIRSTQGLQNHVTRQQSDHNRIAHVQKLSEILTTDNLKHLLNFLKDDNVKIRLELLKGLKKYALSSEKILNHNAVKGIRYLTEDSDTIIRLMATEVIREFEE